MSAGTSFPAVWFLPAVTPLTRRLLVYFDSGAYMIPLYGGYAKGRTTLKETMEWYLTDHHELTNMLSTISLAPPVTIYLQTSVVIGLVVVIALRLAHLLKN
jgi:hypothetical protein